MITATARPGNTASTFLTYLFGTGLSDDRHVVEELMALVNGDIRRWTDEPPAKGVSTGRGTAQERDSDRHAEGRRGDAPEAHRDHPLHRVAVQGRGTIFGERGDGLFRRPPPARASRALGDVLPGRRRRLGWMPFGALAPLPRQSWLMSRIRERI